jgi:hypothetical protein
MSDVITLVNIIPSTSSAETNQDSEANLAVNPANPSEMAATTFTPSPNAGSTKSPVFFSNDGGLTWALKDLIANSPVRDQTLRFATQGGMLYGGVLWGFGSSTASINFDILRTNDFSGATTMTVLAQRKNDDQPFIEAETVPSGPNAGKDRIYVGSNDHAPANIPATIDLSLDAGATPASSVTTQTIVVEGRTVSRDWPQTRPAVHPNGTVYALFYSDISPAWDVVIVRDDNWGSSSPPFQALKDSDGKPGIRITTTVNLPTPIPSALYIGNQRINGDLAIAVDPNNSAIVYVCWGDFQSGTYTLYASKSTDSGQTWPAILRTIDNATNPALAVNSVGRVGFLYQLAAGPSTNQKWQTTLELTTDDFATITSHVLAVTPTNSPAYTGSDPYLGDYLSMMAVGHSFYGIFTADNTPDLANFPKGVTYQRNVNFTTKTLLDLSNNPVSNSIDPFVFSLKHGVGRVVTVIANAGNFGPVCVGSFADEELTIDNGGDGELLITGILAAPPDFQSPSVLSYPIKLGVGDAIDIPIRFAPTSIGLHAGTITITSNDPTSPHIVRVFGDAPTPRLSLAIANSGKFAEVCVGSFVDEPLVLNNSGHCPVTVSAVTSSSAAFLAPEVLSFPLLIGPGDSLALPIRFAPTGFGPVTGVITVASSDPASPHTVRVSGDAPSGKLAVAGSTTFGGVNACCCADRTLSVCNVGDCTLNVTSVHFKRRSRHWKILHNPFPAKLRPGSCLPVVIQYHATEKVARICELVIESDDPATPVKIVEALAYTIWECGCKEGCGKEDCDDCRKNCCDKHSSCRQGYPCCDDDDGEDRRGE